MFGILNLVGFVVSPLAGMVNFSFLITTQKRITARISHPQQQPTPLEDLVAERLIKKAKLKEIIPTDWQVYMLQKLG